MPSNPKSVQLTHQWNAIERTALVQRQSDKLLIEKDILHLVGTEQFASLLAMLDAHIWANRSMAEAHAEAGRTAQLQASTGASAGLQAFRTELKKIHDSQARIATG